MAAKKRKVPVPDLVRSTADDLAYLARQTYAELGRTEVRVASGILRRLLYEGILQAAWEALDLADEPAVEAIDLLEMLGELPRRYVHYAYAGGLELPRAHHMGQALLVVPKDELPKFGGPDAASRVLSSRMRAPTRRLFGLREFSASPAVIAGEAEVARVDVVRYVANKLGGVHLDPARAPASDPLGSRYRFLDEVHVKVGRFPASYFEVLSMASDLSRSASAQELILAADEQYPEEAADEHVLAIREGRLGKYAEFRFEER